MSTIANTIAVAKVTSMLASREMSKRRNYGGDTIDDFFPIMITTERLIVERIYDKDPTYENLQIASDYLYDLCGKYRLQAQAIVDGGGGGSVTPAVPGLQFPFTITSADFETDGLTYNDTRLVGYNLEIFINLFSSNFMYAPADFTYLPTGGFIIIATGFNANDFDYTIRIDKLNNQ